MSLIENTEGRLELIAFARSLRQNATDAEGLLWSCLRNRRVNKRKFRRQHPVGGQHNSPEGRVHDSRREAFLRAKGIETLRFTNHAMLTDTDTVLNVIWDRTRRQAGA
jgi:very-short-patch-repair endonuclease